MIAAASSSSSSAATAATSSRSASRSWLLTRPLFVIIHIPIHIVVISFRFFRAFIQARKVQVTFVARSFIFLGRRFPRVFRFVERRRYLFFDMKDGLRKVTAQRRVRLQRVDKFLITFIEFQIRVQTFIDIVIISKIVFFSGFVGFIDRITVIKRIERTKIVISRKQ